MKKQCKVLRLHRYPNNLVYKFNIHINDYEHVSLPNPGEDLYLLSHESVYGGEWCFERHNNYDRNTVKFELSETDAAWLRDLNMDYIVGNGEAVKKMSFVIDDPSKPFDRFEWYKDFKNNFVNRLSKTSDPNFILEDIDVIKVIATSNPIIKDSCLAIEFDESLNTNDIVEIEILEGKIVSIIKL